MDFLWTPWRYAYVTGAAPPRAKGVPEALSGWLVGDPAHSLSADFNCVFCNMIAAVDYALAHGMAAIDAEREALIVYRGQTVFLCLNRYPYTSGHLMIVPYEHCASLTKLSKDAASEFMTLAQTVESVLRGIYRPDGFNFGLNIGEAAGAGVAHHLHMHALPRWSGDTSFMTVTAETRILPESLAATWQQLREAIALHTAR